MQKESGLSQNEAEKRLKTYGLNEIRDVSKTTPLKILFRQIKSNAIVYLLFAAMLISFFVGKHITAYTILAVIGMVIGVGFIQEFRSEKAIHALKGMLVPVSVVIRDGKEHEIQSSQIVPGDILVLRNGEKIPADCILLEEKELSVNEAILTGEAREVKKEIWNKKEEKPENLIFMGTFIVSGRCIAKVLHTGMKTKFGKIAGLISTTEKDLPLQKKINKIVKYMAILAVVMSVLTGIIMLSRSQVIDSDVITNVLILVIALSVSAFPEGFPVVLITTLSTGAYRMAKLNAIVNRMSIIETLGETTVICADKTGTITKGEMTVVKIVSGDDVVEVSGTGYDSNGEFFSGSKKMDIQRMPFFDRLFQNAVICNDSYLESTDKQGEFRAIGSPTESAVLVMAAKAGMSKENLNSERIDEIPFSSERKMMTVLSKINKEKIVYSKGAPEYILRHCKFIQKGNNVVKLTEQEKKKVLETNKSMTNKALRTLAFAYKKADSVNKKTFEENLIFTGIVGMEDPPRDEVKGAIEQCKSAGIEVKMITGDNMETAMAIAEQVGLRGKVMDGQELEHISEDELAKIIKTVSIFARVKPEHKMRIIKALKTHGEIVTMTGDGVNDAPALKEAHIGVAMGKCGTDVSRSVADLTLKDDNFSTIVTAVREGRTIFKNIRKFVTYQLSCNFSELAILFIGVLLAPFLGWHVPLLLALHILFMNLVTDNLPAITLGLNPPSKDIMAEKPRRNTEILNKKLFGILALSGTVMTAFVLLSYFIIFNRLNESMEYARTVALCTLIGLEIVSAFHFRSFRKGVLTRSPFTNPYLLIASAVSILATIAIVYTPLNIIFETVPLGLYDIIVIISVSLMFIVIFDLLKFINNKAKLVDLEHA